MPVVLVKPSVHVPAAPSVATSRRVVPSSYFEMTSGWLSALLSSGSLATSTSRRMLAAWSEGAITRWMGCSGKT